VGTGGFVGSFYFIRRLVSEQGDKEELNNVNYATI